MFPLHSSADHAFIINRIPHQKRAHQQHSSYTFSGVDQSVSWDAVKMVKKMGTDVQTCPICLDSFVCPRITKCGHSFCLVCLIRHVHSIDAYCGAKAAKCPCCGDDQLRLVDTRPVQFFNVTLPRAPVNNHNHQNSSKKKDNNTNSQGTNMKFVKLHRDKICFSPFLPRANEPRRSVPHALPCQSDKDAMFCRFNYVDPQLLESSLIVNMEDLRSMPREDATFEICKSMAMEIVQAELKLALEEAPREVDCSQRFREPSSGVYQRHHPALMANVESERVMHSPSLKEGTTSSHVESPQPKSLERQDDMIFSMDPNGFTESSTNPRLVEQQMAHLTVGTARNRSASLESEQSYHSSTSVHDNEGQGVNQCSDGKRKHSRRKANKSWTPGSMYLGSDESLFYQADDGQLCFLCGFNVQCLRAEFSASPPSISPIEPLSGAGSKQQTNSRRVEPLPDVINGRVVESERMVVTKQLRQRMRFLSHMPIGSTVTMVEIGLGGLLSNATKRQFAKEFQKRKSARERKSKAEKRADDRAQRREEQRIEQIRAQVPLVNRVFRQEAVDVTSDAFGPSLCSSPPRLAAQPTELVNEAVSDQRQQPQGSLSFSSIARKANKRNTHQGFVQSDFPALGGDSAFPALGSSPSSSPTKHTTATKWKGGNAKKGKKPISLSTLTPLGQR